MVWVLLGMCGCGVSKDGVDVARDVLVLVWVGMYEYA